MVDSGHHIHILLDVTQNGLDRIQFPFVVLKMIVVGEFA